MFIVFFIYAVFRFYIFLVLHEDILQSLSGIFYIKLSFHKSLADLLLLYSYF